MQSTASFIAIFSVWIAGIVFVLYLFLPQISSVLTILETQDATYVDTSLKNEIDIGDKSLTSLSPLAIFDVFTD